MLILMLCLFVIICLVNSLLLNSLYIGTLLLCVTFIVCTHTFVDITTNSIVGDIFLLSLKTVYLIHLCASNHWTYIFTLVAVCAKVSLVIFLFVVYCCFCCCRWCYYYWYVLMYYCDGWWCTSLYYYCIIHQQYKLCKITFINQSNSYAHFIKKMYTLHDNNQGQFKFCNFFFPYPKICIVLSLKHCISKLLFCFRLIIHYLYK